MKRIYETVYKKALGFIIFYLFLTTKVKFDLINCITFSGHVEQTLIFNLTTTEKTYDKSVSDDFPSFMPFDN